MEMITMKEFEGLKSAIDEAKEDDTPFVSTSDNEINVWGNPNKTEVVSADYTVSFAFPNTEEWKKRIEANGDKIVKYTADNRMVNVERTYKNVHLSPRNVGNAVTALTLIHAFMNDVLEDGEVRELSYEEMKDVLYNMNHELSDATYELVASVLRIPPREVEWMLPLNTIMNAVKIVQNNPSAVNESDFFFE